MASRELLPPYRAMLWYAAKLGWQVFPVHLKAPLTQHGLLDSTTDPRIIRAWSERWPNAGVAVRTGAESSIFVLDVDPKNGGDDSLTTLRAQYGDTPATVEALTGGGGRHLIFKHPGRLVQNSTSALGPGLDIRGDGGYIVVAPSLHASGKKYEWEISSRPESVRPAPAPDWLLLLLTNSAAGIRREAPSIQEVIPFHERNATLTSVAGSMRRRAASENVILAALHELNKQCVPPLDDDEVQTIARSVARYDPARMEHDGINLWTAIVGDRFQAPPPPPDDNWDEFTADLEVGAMFYRLGERLVQQDFSPIDEAYRRRSYSALSAAINAITREVVGG